MWSAPPTGSGAKEATKVERPSSGARKVKLQKPEPSKRRRPLWLSILIWGGITTASLFVLGISTVVLVFWMYGRDPNLPNIEKLSDYHPKQVTTILDANDRRVGELFTQRRTVVPYEKIPPIVVDAFVAAEDNKFWT